MANTGINLVEVSEIKKSKAITHYVYCDSYVRKHHDSFHLYPQVNTIVNLMHAFPSM